MSLANETTLDLVEVNKSTTSAVELSPEQDFRRQNVEGSPDSSAVAKNAGKNVGSGEKNALQDLSHSFSGDEMLIRRKKETLQFKAGLDGSRGRSHRKKMKETKGRHILNVLIKIFLLLGSILWLTQLIWTWKDMLKYSTDPSFAILGSEDRLSEMQASLKTTAGMLQLQLDVVDKKVASEVGTAKNEISNNLEEKCLALEKGLKHLEVQTDSLGKSLAEMKEMDFLPEKEFTSFMNDLKKRGMVEFSGHNMSWDAIRDTAKQIVEKELEKHSADGLGRVDYALASAGARVVRHSDPYVHGISGNWITIGQYKFYTRAQKMLEPSFGEPGQCFSLKGSSGFVDIRLRTAIIPEAVTLEHISKLVAYDRSSAPKDCRVSAWFERPEDGTSDLTDEVSLLTKFSYDLEKSNTQTFPIEPTNARAVNMVRFEFSTNYGSSTHTCIYRLRVHGYEPNQGSAGI